MGLFRVFAISVSILSILEASSFSKFSDICETTKKQKCPNIKSEVVTMQKFLKVTTNNHLKVTGKFNYQTKKALVKFQKGHKLPSSGYFGTLTKRAFDKELTKKIKELKSIKSALNKHKLKKLSKKRAYKGIKHISSYQEFKRLVNLRKSYAVFKDSKLLSKANRAKTLLKVDVSEQRVKLLVNGKVALSAPCTTGAKHKLEPNTRTYRDKHTPYGTFRILEKIATKRSTIFGKIYKNGKLVYSGDRRKYFGSWKGAVFVGAPLYKWMRLTSSGIGLHASNHIKRYPGSNGCIRLPKNVANLLFSKLKKGSVVKVVN